MSVDFLKGLVQLSPLWSLSLLAFIPLTAKLLNGNKELKPWIVSSIYVLSVFCSLFLFVFIGFNGKQALSLSFNSYNSGSAVLTGLAGLVSLILFYFNSWGDKKQFTETLFLLCQALAGLYVFCLASDFMTAFIGLETASLLIYICLGMSRKDSFCLEAAGKYFVLSAFAGAVFLYGLSFIFGAGGSVNWEHLFAPSAGINLYNRFFFLGFTLMFSALFFKIALFPFQFWLPDVYQGALSHITAFMALSLKSALVLWIGKLFILPFFEEGSHGSVFLIGLSLAGVLTVLFGNIMALKQNKLKRLLAFSSLAHSGYLMMALTGILHLEGQSAKDLSIIFYYLLAYIFLTGGLITGFQSLEKKSSQPEWEDLRGLFKHRPLFALGVSACLLGLAGIPPSFGFFAKMGLFQPLILSESWWMLFWAFVGSAIGLYYYIKPVVFMLLPIKPPVLINVDSKKSNLSFLLFLAIMGWLGGFVFGKFFY